MVRIVIMMGYLVQYQTPYSEYDRDYQQFNINNSSYLFMVMNATIRSNSDNSGH